MRDILVHIAVEFLNVLPIPLDHLGLTALRLGDEFEDVVGFQIIIQPREKLNRSKRPVTVIASFFEGSAEFSAFFFGQIEEFFYDGELLVDLFLGEAEVGNIEEAYSLAIALCGI
jgi:hypothetical protein